ncbi:MAG TPA: YCF48-related protein [Ramlibacter sp.]|nr:YCF48-related protein [Ramlibacter sp.]
MGLAVAGAAQGAADAAAAARAQLERAAPAAWAPERALLLSVARAGQRLVAVGEHGVIAVSDDGGRQWRGVPSGVSAALTQVRFADAQKGWAVGHFGLVLQTLDGGATWQRRLDGVQAAALSLKQRTAAGEDERALRSAQRLVDDGPDKPLLDVLTDGPRVLVVGAFNTAWRSDDAGRQWQDATPLAANPRDLHLNGAALAAGKLWLVGESGLVLSGTPDGRDFSRVTLPYQGSLIGVLPLGTQGVLVHGLRGNVLVSADAGASWKAAKLPEDAGTTTVNCAARLADGRVVLGNQAGDLLVSADQGQSFTRVQRVGIPITGIAQAADGALVLTTYAGAMRLPATDVQASR